jgi:RimJ/RimL family protein N-acetyltransferase
MKYLLDGEETDRLLFRLTDRTYFDAWLEFFRHPDAAYYLGYHQFGSPEDQCRQWFSRVEERYANDLGGMNALIEKTTGEFVGQCGLLVQDIDGERELEIGYSILPRFWGMGYATEAAVKCRDYAFQKGYASSLISIITEGNTMSEKVAERNGMIRTKKSVFKNMDVNIYRIDIKSTSGIPK